MSLRLIFLLLLFFLIEFTRFKPSFRGETKKAWSLESIFYNKFFEISAKERSK